MHTWKLSIPGDLSGREQRTLYHILMRLRRHEIVDPKRIDAQEHIAGVQPLVEKLLKAMHT